MSNLQMRLELGATCITKIGKPYVVLVPGTTSSLSRDLSVLPLWGTCLHRDRLLHVHRGSPHIYIIIVLVPILTRYKAQGTSEAILLFLVTDELLDGIQCAA